MYYSYSCNSSVSFKLFPHKVLKNKVQSTTALYPPAMALLIPDLAPLFIKAVSPLNILIFMFITISP